MEESKRQRKWIHGPGWTASESSSLTPRGLNFGHLPRLIRCLRPSNLWVALKRPVFYGTAEEARELIDAVNESGERLRNLYFYSDAQGPAIRDAVERERWIAETQKKIIFKGH